MRPAVAADLAEARRRTDEHLGRQTASPEAALAILLVAEQVALHSRVSREAWDEMWSAPAPGRLPCPDCGSTSTHPRPGCHCPPGANGYRTRHINREHHTCEPKPAAVIDRDYLVPDAPPFQSEEAHAATLPTGGALGWLLATLGGLVAVAVLAWASWAPRLGWLR